MSRFQRVESIDEIRLASFASVRASDESEFKSLFVRLRNSLTVFHNEQEVLKCLPLAPPDIIFIGPYSSEVNESKHSLCKLIRDAGFLGVLVLLTQEIASLGGTAGITASGYDHFLIEDSTESEIEDSVNWAILNRRRKNKYKIQFDKNPDAFFTIDSDGRVFDINEWGAIGSGLSPKKIVVDKLNVRSLRTLDCFESLIKPLIAETKIGMTFLNSVNEEDRIYQVKTQVHNMSMIGLVATVIKTDITETIYSRSIDILLHSVNLLSERDHYTAGHSSRVHHYCRMIVESLGLHNEKRFKRDLYFAALLHDIGKIGIRDDILLKETRLTKKEFSMLESHPEKGYNALKHYRFLDKSTIYILNHHERPDGKGYPNRVTEKDIPFGAAIISVADGFDAMTSTRPYRKPRSFKEAVDEVKKYSGSQFNREASEALIKCISPDSLNEARNISKKPLSSLQGELIRSLI